MPLIFCVLFIFQTNLVKFSFGEHFDALEI